MKKHLYLVSDFTGDTVMQIARSATAYFPDLTFIKHFWPLVKTKKHVDDLMENIVKKPGPVICTIDNNELETYLKAKCQTANVNCISVLDEIISKMSVALNSRAETPIKKLDDNYYQKIKCIEYTLRHDDGEMQDIEKADIVITGVSRTSKTPTSIYLAYKGYMTANIPYIPLITTIDKFPKTDCLIVGLTIDPKILVSIRKDRAKEINMSHDSIYSDYQTIVSETQEANKFIRKNGWPLINVTNKSVEETAATIIKLLHKKQQKDLNSD